MNSLDVLLSHASIVSAGTVRGATMHDGPASPSSSPHHRPSGPRAAGAVCSRASAAQARRAAMAERGASGHGFPPLRKEGRCGPYGPGPGRGPCWTGPPRPAARSFQWKLWSGVVSTAAEAALSRPPKSVLECSPDPLLRQWQDTLAQKIMGLFCMRGPYIFPSSLSLFLCSVVADRPWKWLIQLEGHFTKDS